MDWHEQWMSYEASGERKGVAITIKSGEDEEGYPVYHWQVGAAARGHEETVEQAKARALLVADALAVQLDPDGARMEGVRDGPPPRPSKPMDRDKVGFAR